jgi:hypothetical protein
MIPQGVRAVAVPRRINPFQLQLPKAYAPWQHDLMTSKCRLQLFVLGTKCGKTLGGSVRMAAMSMLCPADQHGLFRIIAPTYALSSITFRYMERIFADRLKRPEGWSDSDYSRAAATYDAMKPEKSTAKLWMRWRHNNALVKCIHAQDPETTIEGERVHGALLDEASKMPEQVYASHTSTTTQTNGWTAITTTPRGKNWVYKLYKNIEDHMRWCERNERPYEMFCATAKTIDSPFVTQAVVEQARRTLPARMFKQLYEAEFVDDGDVFSGFRTLCEGVYFDEADRELHVPFDANQMEVVIGADWARTHDYTVFTAWDINTRPARVVGWMRFNGQNYRTMIRQIFEFGKKFKDVVQVVHDKTGIGDVIDELMSQLPWSVKGVVFTNESKAEMVTKLMVAIQHGKVRFPNWETLIREMDAFEVETNELGRMKFNAPSGQHDDVVCSLFLGFSVVDQMITQGAFEVRFLDDLVNEPADSDEGGYGSLASDEDGEDSGGFQWL